MQLQPLKPSKLKKMYLVCARTEINARLLVVTLKTDNAILAFEGYYK